MSSGAERRDLLRFCIGYHKEQTCTGASVPFCFGLVRSIQFLLLILGLKPLCFQEDSRQERTLTQLGSIFLPEASEEVPTVEPVPEVKPLPASCGGGGSDGASSGAVVATSPSEVKPLPASCGGGGSEGGGDSDVKPLPASSGGGGSEGGDGEWEDIVIDDEFNHWHDDKGKFFVTGRHENGTWFGYAFAMSGEFRRFFSFEANEDEVHEVAFSDGKHPVVLRKKGCVQQIKVLWNDPEYQLQEGEWFPVVFQNHRFWHAGEDDNWHNVYGERRYADEIHLTTMGGGPAVWATSSTSATAPFSVGTRRWGRRCSTLTSRWGAG